LKDNMTRLFRILLVLLLLFGFPLICAFIGSDFGTTAMHAFKCGLLIECLIIICMPWWGIPLIMICIMLIGENNKK